MKEKNKKDIYIVIPAYNEGARIDKVINEFRKYSYRIVVVDDGSFDNTSDVLTKINDENSDIKVLTHKINLGKGAAMKTGAEYSFKNNAKAVIFVDSDGQHSAQDLPKFIKALNDGYDLAFGSRNMSYGVPLVRFLGNKAGAILISLMFNIYVSDLLCGYRAVTKNGYGMVKWESSGYGVETEIVVKTGKYKVKYCEVPVETIYLDKVKGVSLLDALNILMDVFYWKIKL